MAGPTDDPRPDQQRSGDDKYPDPPDNSKPFPAPGGVGNDKPADSDKKAPSSDR